jgi:outer membrane protein assembly factor BamB
MSRRLLLCFVVLCLSGSSSRAQPSISRDDLPTRTALARLGLEKQWTTVAPIGAVNERLLRMNVDGGQLFLQTSLGHLHSYDAESGRYLWGTRLDEASQNPLPVSVNSSQVFVTNLRTLYCLDRGTGGLIWEKQLEDLPSTGTVADEDFVVVGLNKGKFVAYSTRDRTKEDPPGRSAGAFLWAWQTNARLEALPVLTPKVVAFGSEDHKVYVAIKANTFAESKLLYRFLAGGPIKARLGAFGNRTLIVPCGDFNVYAIDLFSGENRWTVSTGAPVDREPMVAGDEVIVLNARGRVMSIDGMTGSVRWDQQTNGHELIAVSPSRVYLTTLENRLIILDRGTGQVLADARDTAQRAGFDNRNLTMVFPNQINDRLYFASPSGVVVCLREIGHLQPTPLRDPSLPPFGTIPPDGFTSDVEEPPAATVPANEPGAEGDPAEVPAPR